MQSKKFITGMNDVIGTPLVQECMREFYCDLLEDMEEPMGLMKVILMMVILRKAICMWMCIHVMCDEHETKTGFRDFRHNMRTLASLYEGEPMFPMFIGAIFVSMSECPEMTGAGISNDLKRISYTVPSDVRLWMHAWFTFKMSQVCQMTYNN